ncbi:hypothetical protein AN958_08571, partial [Leucoagaricus sp. SymC.cos]
SYSPAPESGIRSTLQPDSPIYHTNVESEEEVVSSAANSPPHSSETTSPVEDPEDESDSATPTPEPVPPPQPIAGPSRIYLRLPPLDSNRVLKGKSTRPSIRGGRPKKLTPIAGSITTPPITSSRQNSESSDTLGSLRGYIYDERGHKKYPCLRCDKLFGRSHDRKRHMEESTSCRGGLGGELTTEVTPMWVCERCGDSFSRRDSMNRHMKNPDACKAHRPVQ